MDLPMHHALQPIIDATAMIILFGAFLMAWLRSRRAYYFVFSIAVAVNATRSVAFQAFQIYLHKSGGDVLAHMQYSLLNSEVYRIAALIALIGAILFFRDEIRRARASRRNGQE